VTICAQKEVGAVAPLGEMSLVARLTGMAVSYVRYLWKAAWPHDLSVLYLVNPAGPPWWLVALSLTTLLAIFVFAVGEGRKRPFLLVGYGWYLIALVPVSGLFQAGRQAMADRFAYLPLVGIYLSAVWLMGSVSRTRSRVAAAAITGVSVVLLAGTSMVQVRHWRDSGTLFRHALEVDPENWLAYNNLGAYLADRREYGEALGFYREALRRKPDSPSIRANMGIVLNRLDRPSEALGHLLAARRGGLDDATLRHNLGLALGLTGRTEEAAVEFRAAIARDPLRADAYFDLGIALGKLGRGAEAAEAFGEAARLRPSDEEAKTLRNEALLGRGTPGNSPLPAREPQTVSPGSIP
jgi:Flp pilus assembly protein TadD